MAPILAETRDPTLRETLRDIGCAQTFRRDVYRKGVAPLPAAEQQVLLDGMTLAGMGMAVPEGGATFATPIGNVTGRPEVYQPLLSMLEAGPLSVRQARESPAFAGRPLVELMQAFTLLVAGGYAHPMLPDGGTTAGHEAARRLNLAIARANANGADLPRLAAPAIGSAIGADILETLLVGELLAGKPADVDALATELLGMLGRSGRSVQREGKPVTDPAEALADRDRSGCRHARATGAAVAGVGRAGRLAKPRARVPGRAGGPSADQPGQRISPVSGLDGSAPSLRGIRPARYACRPASIASFIALAIRIGSLACAIAEFSSTASQPSSIAIAASEAVPTPASTRNGTLVCSRIIQIIAAFWMPRPEPIGAPSGMIATQPMSSSRLHATGSSAV